MLCCKSLTLGIAGARYCSVVGDFNGWSPTENCAREGHFGHDDYGYWFIILEDKLRDGEEPDEFYFQQYNYVDDYDKGDNGVTVEELFKKANDDYWEPGEDRYIKSRFEIAAKLYEQIFGPNGPQTEDELEEIPDAETRYKAWKEQHKDDPPSNLPCYDVIDDGKEYDIYNIVNDPVSRAKFRAKKPPLPYWLESRKGRKAWLKKYAPAIPHGSKYRVYFNTPDGPLERVPAWAPYVIPGNLTLRCFTFCCVLCSLSFYCLDADPDFPFFFICLCVGGGAYLFPSISEGCINKIAFLESMLPHIPSNLLCSHCERFKDQKWSVIGW